MRKLFFTAIATVSCFIFMHAQSGNEWIDYSKTYYKIKVAEDGVYRIDANTLADAGLTNPTGTNLRLYHLGQQVPIYVTTDGMLGGGDFVEFIGRKNRGELDRSLYVEPDTQQLNPRYSVITDTSVYFLTIEEQGQPLRFDPIVNDLSNPPPAEPFYTHETRMDLAEGHFNPRLQESVSYSHFSLGEGFASNERREHTYNINTSNVFQNGSALLEMRFVASNLTQHELVAEFAGEEFYRQMLTSVQVRTIFDTVPSDMLTAAMQVKLNDVSATGRSRIAYIALQYPRFFDFDGLPYVSFDYEGSADAQYFELADFDHVNERPVIYDAASSQRMEGIIEDGLVKFVLPAGSDRELHVASLGDGIRQIFNLAPVTFTDWSNDDTGYIVLSSNRLKSSGAVDTYLNYRRSSEGGNFNAAFYSVEEVYDQFGYGVARHPQGIRNFTQFVANNWANARMLLLIGKGIEYSLSRNCENACDGWFHVPTLGVPGSDNQMVTLPGQKLPVVPIGRIPAINGEEVITYLDKVREHDATPFLPQTLEDKAWTKNILHLGGGADAAQQAQILGHLDNFKSIAEGSLYGGNVTTYTKSSTNATGESNSELIIKLLEEGVSLIKFFGHSSASTLDFQINNPKDWNNAGKYPIFSAMGCSAGQIHSDFRSLSEIFVFEPNAGAIAFVAGSGSQFLGTLATWGEDWYEHWGSNFDETTVGFSLQQSLQPISLSTSFTNVILVEQQTLTGDPALRFYPSPGRDYLWDFESVAFEPEILTTKVDSFTIHADLINLGVNIADSVGIQIEHELPDGQSAIVFEGKVPVSGFRQKLSLKIPMNSKANGLNKFYLTVDPENAISELPAPAAENNNHLANDAGVEGISVFILDNRALATYPTEFSIVTDPTFELIASYTNAFIKGSDLVMEMDTTELFNSPALDRNIFKKAGGVVKWSPTTAMIPNTVYYWRVSQDSTSADQTYTWDGSSFLYLPGGEEGWNQSHYYQFLKDDFTGMGVNADRAFAFASSVRNVWVQNAVDTASFERFQFFLDNANFISFYRPWKPYDAHVFVAAFDPVTSKTLKNPAGGAFGAINPFPNQRPVFPFNTATPESRNDLANFLQHEIPDDYYVVLYTYQRDDFLDYHADEWAADSVAFGQNLFSVIEAIHPQSNIRKLQGGSVPYTLMYQKGGNFIGEQIAIDFDATTNLDANFPIIGSSGRTFSTQIGPADQWHRLEWSFEQKEEQDTFALRVIGIRADLTDTTLIAMSTEAEIDLSGISAEEYPHLRMELISGDPSDFRSSPQLTHWRVHYDGVPEFVFNPTAGFEFEKDSMQLGGRMSIQTFVENVSKYPSVAFPIQYSVISPNNQQLNIMDEIPALLPGESTSVAHARFMDQMSGDHTLVIELNPDEMQSEVHHFNNFGILPFHVVGDDRNPLLDVVFDGRHIVDGDVVARQPEIQMTLTDENAFIALDDVESFELSLKVPGAFDFIELSVLAQEFSFLPGDPASGVNAAQLMWNPTFEEDGFYTLRVQARDKAGNVAGDVFYEVRFEIYDRASIANLTVYPNPTDHHVRFSFVLTGETSPETFSLRITDAHGKLVKSMTEADFIPHVGTHELLWDCTTTAGERVPQGVYFYQVMASSQGREYNVSGFAPLYGKVIVAR